MRPIRVRIPSSSARHYAGGLRSLIRLYVRPQFGKLKVAVIRHAEIASLHREIAKRAPYRGNQLVAVLSTMMSMAIKEGWREDNPTRGIERAHEEKRERFLSPAEIVRLAEALAAHPEKISANAIGCCCLPARAVARCSARPGTNSIWRPEAWTKPSAHTKQTKVHRVPLSAPALALIADMEHESRCGLSVCVSERRRRAGRSRPATAPTYGPLTEIKRTWASVCTAARQRKAAYGCMISGTVPRSVLGIERA